MSVSCGLYAAENFQADTARGGTGVPSGKETPKVHFAYDVNFEMKFDNRENTVSLSPSMTIFGARLTPELGIGVRQSDGTRHRVMLGVDVMKDFGKGPDVSADGTVTGDRGYANAALFHEMTLYYRLEKRMGKTGFALTAGIFPKRYSMSEEYSPAFISDSLKLKSLTIWLNPKPEVQRRLSPSWKAAASIALTAWCLIRVVKKSPALWQTF